MPICRSPGRDRRTLAGGDQRRLQCERDGDQGHRGVPGDPDYRSPTRRPAVRHLALYQLDYGLSHSGRFWRQKHDHPFRRAIRRLARPRRHQPRHQYQFGDPLVRRRGSAGDYSPGGVAVAAAREHSRGVYSRGPLVPCPLGIQVAVLLPISVPQAVLAGLGRFPLRNALSVISLLLRHARS